MRIFIYFVVIFLTLKTSLSNEIEVIELHENKSLDQMVLDQIKDDEIENENSNENISLDQIPENEINESETVNITEEEVTLSSINDTNFINSLTLEEVENYLQFTTNINSETLKNEYLSILDTLDLDYKEDENKEKFYQIVKYFYKTGDISKSYNLTNLREIENDKYFNFYKKIEINYMLSTLQLDNICELKNEYSNNISLDYFLLEKVDIFCLVLEEKFSEAELLNSLLIETETILDNNFQDLYLIVSNSIEQESSFNIDFEDDINKDLIYLYSAMARIAEVPLNEKFLNIDPINLAIPIILNKSSPIDLRIKAANKSYKNGILSIESLAALYQSVDFDSKQLDDPENTILELKNNEILMAYYFQLINIQIFPSERIKALKKFWDFAYEIELEDIAYSLTHKIVQSIDISSENINFSSQIAKSYMYNNDYDNSLKWVELYESTNQVDEISSYIRILLSLYTSENIEGLVNTVQQNSEQFNLIDSRKFEELIFVLQIILDQEQIKKLSINFIDSYDNRLMPSLFILQNIKDSIKNKNDEKFLIYSLISLNSKSWNELHPEHLKLILSGFINYNKGSILKQIIIEVFEDYKIL